MAAIQGRVRPAVAVMSGVSPLGSVTTRRPVAALPMLRPVSEVRTMWMIKKAAKGIQKAGLVGLTSKSQSWYSRA